MRRWFKPTPTGVLLFIAAVCLWANPQSSTHIPVEGEPISRTAIGLPTAFSWDSPGTWRVHAPGILGPLILWFLSTLLGGLMHHWRAWRLVPKAFLVFLVVPLAAVGGGIGFSKAMWGYAWSLPALDSRVDDMQWTALDAFTSAPDGGWTAAPRDVLTWHKEEPADDYECCETGRILKVVRSQAPIATFPGVDADELRDLGQLVVARVRLEPATPGYETSARELKGIVAKGIDPSGQPLQFISFRAGMVSNDHFPFYEVLIATSPSPTILSQRRYFGDIAGIEGATAPVVATVLFLLGLPTATVLILLGAFIWALFRAAVGMRRAALK